jgi:hypothetical protein
MEPACSLYKKTEFTLRFPDSSGVDKLPESLWWTVFLTCLHSHWILLRPCTVILPVRLPPGHLEVWRRLLDAEIDTADAYRESPPAAGGVEWVENGEPVETGDPVAEQGRCATAFSGGKDSLLQTGLLCELTKRPMLVTTTSPMDGKHDHSTAKRRRILAQIQARRDVELIEVHTDFRTNLDNHYSQRLGWNFSVNEISDTFLYTASLIAAGAASGATHLFLASEAEVQENAELGGKTVQHKHFMYSAVTQRALEALLAGNGIRYGSMTSSLHNNAQIPILLWTRYHDLADLQYSCWMMAADEELCSKCEQCFRTALCALAAGGNPERMGIRLETLFNTLGGWNPREIPSASSVPLLPTQTQRVQGDRQTVDMIHRVPLRRIMSLMTGRRPELPMEPRTRSALKAYAQLRRRVARIPMGNPLGYRPGFLRQLDPLLRDQLGALYAAHFQPEPEEDYRGILDRGDALAAWICEPLKTHASRN